MSKYRNFTEEEIKWINSLQRCMKKAPKLLFMFVGGTSGSMDIFPKDINNERYWDGLSIDINAPFLRIKTNIEMDGGDY